jgi:Zn-finger protein
MKDQIMNINNSEVNCSFYPCHDKTIGDKFIITNELSIWDCSNCNYIHKKIIVDKIFKLIQLMENDFIKLK